MTIDFITQHILNEEQDHQRRRQLESRYENQMQSVVSSYDNKHRKDLHQCKNLPETKDEYKCYIRVGMQFSKELTTLLNTYKPKCQSIKDNVEKRACMYAVNRIFNGRKHSINQDLKYWRGYLKSNS